MSECKPHRFLLVFCDPECEEVWRECQAGDTSRKDEACSGQPFQVQQVECPYGPREELLDCQAIEECSCLHPDDDPKYEDCAGFTYRIDESLPIGHQDRFVRVWDPDTTLNGMQKTFDYDKALDRYEDKHEHGRGWESVPGECWVASGDHDYESLLDLPNLQPGWFSGWADNEGAFEDSYLVVTPA